MGLNKKYDGYKSYQYLEENVDYKKFELQEHSNYGEPYEVPLSEAEEARVKALIEENLYISLHDHPVLYPKKMENFFDYVSEGRCWTAYEFLAQSYYDAIFDNLLDGTACITSKSGWKWQDVIYDLGMRLSDIAHQDFIIRGESIEDIKKAHKEGKIALFPAFESATPIENELDRIDILYGLGVRMMGIVYSESNSLGTGLKEPRDGGLTYFGREAVGRMDKLGMAIDVSHASDQTCLDVFESSTNPVFISHAGARAQHEVKRLMPDEVIKACAETGGVIGIEAAPHTTLSKHHPQHTIESVMDHFKYIVDLVGIDHVTFGPDALYGDHVGLHQVFSSHLSIKESHEDNGEEQKEKKEFPQVEYVKGFENPTEISHNIVRWLVKHGYSDEEIQKVISANTLRTLSEIWR